MRWWREWQAGKAAEKATKRAAREASWEEQKRRDAIHLTMVLHLLGRSSVILDHIYELSQSRYKWHDAFRAAILVQFRDDVRWTSLSEQDQEDIVNDNIKLFFNGNSAPDWKCSADYLGVGKTTTVWMRYAGEILDRVEARLQNQAKEITQ